jgi:photosystem II stability/assembly factor-like uncharacterized protein
MRTKQQYAPSGLRPLPETVALAALALAGAGAPARLEAQSPPAAAQAAYAPALFQGLQYRSIGPSRGGRVTAVAGHRMQPSTFYMGATGGGVWKTTDYGQSWENVSDGYFATGSIGAIRVAPSDPNVVWVGTGSDGLRSNVIVGKGVYRSTDGGKRWTHVGLEKVGLIGAVEVDPRDPNVAFVAAIGQPFGKNPERGVFRTRDGGKSWEKVLFVSDSTGAVDLEFHPKDPNVVYATTWRGERKPWTIISGAREGGVYRSDDGGTTWKLLTRGLPTGLRGKADLAVSPADPDRVYVLMEAPEDKGEGGLYRSDDRGETWRLVSTHRPLLDRPFYYTNITADPKNADVVYVMATQFWKSTDGGKTWQRRPTPHGDDHDLWINPDNPDIMIESNDGGANITLDGGRSWSTQNNQPTAELYQVDLDDRFPYWVYAGQQDNGTAIAVPSLPSPLWSQEVPNIGMAVGGCETGPAVPKPGDPEIIYTNCKGRFGRLNLRTGQEKQYNVGAANMYGHNPKELKYRFQRVSPIKVSPHDPNVVYHASQYLHRTTDEGVTWETISPDLTANDPRGHVISGTPITRDVTGEEFFSTIYVVEESPLEKGLIWVGANDGPVHVTRDGGKSWSKVTPKGLPAGARIQAIEPSPHRPGKAYVAAYAYLLDDWQPYIFKTEDYGKSWTRLTTGTNGISADWPTRVVREDPSREGLLYAGTEFGMFVSFDDGKSWQPFQLNLPVTPITDIKVYRKDLVLSTMGRGFWILDNLTPLHQLSAQVRTAKAHLFHPREAYRMRYRLSSGPDAPQYLPAGAVIDYALADEQVGPVTLEILDAKGNLVRGFSSEAAGETTQPGPGMHRPTLERVGTPRLPRKAGVNRFIWDLAHAGPWDADARRSGRNGPLAVPGTYQLRLTVGDWSETRPLEVKIDPRVAADRVTQADLEEQLAFGLKVRDAVTEVKRLVVELNGARERLSRQVGEAGRNRKASGRAEAALRSLEALEGRLVTAEGRYMQPMLVDQLTYLYSMTNDADQKIGKDMVQRFDELKAELAGHVATLRRILESDVAQLEAAPRR